MKEYNSPTYFLEKYNSNNIFIKRDDLIPYSFGGNKVRKAKYFFQEIKDQKADIVVTYGSNSSNHCRIVANMCWENNLECIIISPTLQDVTTFNHQIIERFNARVILTELENVKSTIDETIDACIKNGKNTYFIPGGGHGNIGTSAYINAFKEIIEFQTANEISFDAVIFASGTGTTQAGLVIGNSVYNDNKAKIIGMSIARESEYGKRVIEESVKSYCKEFTEITVNEEEIILIDNYRCGGYGRYNSAVENIIEQMMSKYGIPTDPTYTAKALYGMYQYIIDQNIKNQNILFIHTGGTPIYFDYLNQKRG